MRVQGKLKASVLGHHATLKKTVRKWVKTKLDLPMKKRYEFGTIFLFTKYFQKY